ncbi:MAG: hypothetical protein QM689_10300 [Oscillospiraceae bacterium]
MDNSIIVARIPPAVNQCRALLRNSKDAPETAPDAIEPWGACLRKQDVMDSKKNFD